MENLNAEDRARLESKIMDTITDFLERSNNNEIEFLMSDTASNRSYNSVLTRTRPSSSIIQEAKTAGLMAKLELVKKKNALLNQISEQKTKLSELKLEIKLEEAKAQQAVLTKYDHELKPSTSEIQPPDFDSIDNEC